MTSASERSALLMLAEKVAAQGAVAPRISLTDLKNAITDVRYLTPGVVCNVSDDHPLMTMTLCFLTTFSGFVVVGKSACMDPRNYDSEKGQLFAYEDAIKQLWPLTAFARLERIYHADEGEKVP